MSRFSVLGADVTDEEYSTGEAAAEVERVEEEEEEEEAEAGEESAPVRARQRLAALQLRREAAGDVERRGSERRADAVGAPSKEAQQTEAAAAAEPPTTPQAAREGARKARVAVAGTDVNDAPPPAELPVDTFSPSAEDTATAAAPPPPPAAPLRDDDEGAAIDALLRRLPHGVTRVGPFEYELARDWARGMRVPARFFASLPLLQLLTDECAAAAGGATGGGFLSALQQLANVATLPGIVGASLGMPDMHAGYGFAIGNVAAFDLEGSPEAVVSPGGVGFDINCGVRLLRSSLTAADLAQPGVLSKLADALNQRVPAGTGGDARSLALDAAALERVLNEGMAYLEMQGLCWPEDRDVVEERGCFPGADAAKVSARAKARGADQAGTLGAGNHYCEVQLVEEVYDDVAAAAMGLRKDGVCVMLHTGSRGLGHQVCTDYLQRMDASAAKRKAPPLVDRQLACCPVDSAEGRDYLAAMRAAANFAFVNRSVLAADVRAAFAAVFGGNAKSTLQMHAVYDVAHNVAKVETHTLPDGTRRCLLVHRKGATRAFPPGHPDVPHKYRDIGQPVLVGGSMSSASYVLVGTACAMARTFGSTCHGAGRALSRAKALKTLDSKAVLRHCEDAGVEVRIKTRRLAAEEAEQSYKDVSEVVRTCHDAGISRLVAKLRPVACIKG